MTLPVRPQTLDGRIRSRRPTLGSYGIDDAYTRDEVDAKIPGILDSVRMRNEFGLRGDGVSLQTDVIQDVLQAAADRYQIADFGSMVLPQDGPLDSAGCPGIRFDQVSHGDSGGPGFLITGSGYTALTVSGKPQTFRAALYGTGNTANGLLLQNPVLALMEHIRVYNLDGFGCKINKMWDSVLQSVSVEKCGNLTHWAFSMNDDGDTCNMSHILRLQSELANYKAINISPNSVSCLIENIHSERATAYTKTITNATNATPIAITAAGHGLTTGDEVRIDTVVGNEAANNTWTVTVTGANTFTLDGSVGTGAYVSGGVVRCITWRLGTNRCLYNAGRFQAATNPSDAILLITGGGKVNSLAVEGAADVMLDSFSSDGYLSIDTVNIEGTLHPLNGQEGRIEVRGGYIAELKDKTVPLEGIVGPDTASNTNAAGLFFEDLNLPEVIVGFQTNPNSRAITFDNCFIGDLSSSSDKSAATFRHCTIAEGNNLLRAETVLIDSDVTCASTIIHNFLGGMLRMINSTIHGALTYSNVDGIRMVNSHITSTVQCGDAGNHDVQIDSQSTMGPGTTDCNVAPTGGSPVTGDTHWNPVPTSGSPIGWRRSVAGLWKSMGNLA